MRSRSVLFMLACLAGSRVSAQLQPVDKTAIVQFKIKNLGFSTTGSFSGLKGRITFDPAHPEQAVFDATVDANSINTDNSMRDDHLRRETYFDAQHFPDIHLVSARIIAHKGTEYLFNGRLTIKGHAKDVSFIFTATPVDGGYRFQGSFTINRKDFDIGGFSSISDALTVNLDVTAK
jgi:polyisoprenoid-binding protein YceI